MVAKLPPWGQKVRAARERLGLTLNEAARRANVDKGLLYRIETGERTDVRLSTAVALCKALGLSLDYIASRKPARKR
jgi:transcriptional regulator with XRE-family HTH domain